MLSLEVTLQWETAVWQLPIIPKNIKLFKEIKYSLKLNTVISLPAVLTDRQCPTTIFQRGLPLRITMVDPPVTVATVLCMTGDFFRQPYPVIREFKCTKVTYPIIIK